MSDTIGKMSQSDNSNMALSLLRMMGQMEFMFRKNAETLMDDRVKDLYLNKDNKFDLVLSGYFMNDFQLGFGENLVEGVEKWVAGCFSDTACRIIAKLH